MWKSSFARMSLASCHDAVGADHAVTALCDLIEIMPALVVIEFRVMELVELFCK